MSEMGQLRFLRVLVTVLTATMILGVGAIVVLLALRLTAEPAPLPLPEEVVLPDGAEALAVTASADWYAVVTRDGRILVFDRATGTLRREILIDEAPLPARRDAPPEG